MCMSVPQIAVLAISMSTSFGPTFGSGIFSSQMPGAGCCFTSAFMDLPLSVDHAELVTDEAESLECALELLAVEGGGHLRADARLALWHDRVGEADHVYALLEQPVGHAGGEGRIAEHHRD